MLFSKGDQLRNVIERAIYRWADPSRPVDALTFDPFASPWQPVASRPAAAPAPVVNTSFSAVVVQSKEAALAGLKSSEGQAFIIETIEQNGSTVAKIVGVK